MLLRQLLEVRSALRGGSLAGVSVEAQRAVDAAKRVLGRRGTICWNDGEPDLNGPYA